MAKHVVWTQRAQADRRQILKYWLDRNKSSIYCIKLNYLFKQVVKLISNYPQIGKPTSDANARIKVVKDYLVIYQETETTISILTIWDTRQNPEKLKHILK